MLATGREHVQTKNYAKCLFIQGCSDDDEQRRTRHWRREWDSKSLYGSNLFAAEYVDAPQGPHKPQLGRWCPLPCRCRADKSAWHVSRFTMCHASVEIGLWRARPSRKWRRFTDRANRAAGTTAVVRHRSPTLIGQELGTRTGFLPELSDNSLNLLALPRGLEPLFSP
jgi:hypothetical protein